MKKIKVSKDLLKIKDMIGGLRRIKPDAGIGEVFTQLKDMNTKIEKIETELKKKKQTQVRLKRKKQMIFLLNQQKKLTASGIGKMLKLSRTATSEYLKEMEREGIVKGENQGKEKFYRLLKDEESNSSNIG